VALLGGEGFPVEAIAFSPEMSARPSEARSTVAFRLSFFISLEREDYHLNR